MPHNQGPPSPKLIEREDEGTWMYYDQIHVDPQDRAPNGHAHHIRRRELPRQ